MTTDPTETKHRDGIAWHEAPIPARLHVCEAQTTGWVQYFTFIERCACGGLRMDRRGGWMDRNSRRKDEPESPRLSWWRKWLTP